MSTWPSVSLAEISSKPQYGAIARGQDRPIGPLFVRQTDITGGRIDWETVPFCDLDAVSAKRYALKRGDLLISRLGNGVGNAATVPHDRDDAVFAGYLVRFQPNPEEAEAQFVGYQLQSKRWLDHVTSFRSGAAQPTLNAQQMGDFTFLLPPLAEQRAIAATLGALDDKIESNRRAIEIVQRITRAVFSRWRSEATTVEASTFGAYADVYGGATPKTAVAEYWGGHLDWTTPTDVTGLSAPYLFGTSRRITDSGLQSSNTVMHPSGTIFMTSRATIGAFAISQVPAATNQGFIAVRPRRDADRYFLFEEMRARVPEFLENANGSTFLEISRGRFKELPLDLPAREDIALLDEQLTPLHTKAAQLASESERLGSLRDSLLPELLTGRISAAQEQVE